MFAFARASVLRHDVEVGGGGKGTGASVHRSTFDFDEEKKQVVVGSYFGPPEESPGPDRSPDESPSRVGCVIQEHGADDYCPLYHRKALRRLPSKVEEGEGDPAAGKNLEPFGEGAHPETDREGDGFRRKRPLDVGQSKSSRGSRRNANGD